MRLVVKAATDLGRRRDHNEDCHATWIPDPRSPGARHGALLMVADGMGGSQAGEVASRITTDTVVRQYRNEGHEGAVSALLSAITLANEAVHRESVTHPDRGGMGTTCTAAVVRDRELYIGHVGDSRAYLVRGGGIRQLTQDHSLVAQLVREQQITEEQARVDPRRNVVTRSVGVGSEVQVDAWRHDEPLEPGDTIVLCTDGLHGVVVNDEIAEIASGPDLEDACRRLVALANERGGPDNITVVLARLEDGGA
jgi:serine/threonine protein phosphatase PrpC